MLCYAPCTIGLGLPFAQGPAQWTTWHTCSMQKFTSTTISYSRCCNPDWLEEDKGVYVQLGKAMSIGMRHVLYRAEQGK